MRLFRAARTRHRQAPGEPAATAAKSDQPAAAGADASRPYDAFLCYARADQRFVRALHAALVERGKRVWADWRDIPPTAPWPEEIDRAIERADAFVFVLSQAPGPAGS
jgi:hypothetical protein